jgi:hypothetical protein
MESAIPPDAELCPYLLLCPYGLCKLLFAIQALHGTTIILEHFVDAYLLNVNRPLSK